MAVAYSRIEAADELARRAGALLESAHSSGLRTSEQYAAYLNDKGLTRPSGLRWDRAKVQQAIKRYRKLGGAVDLLMVSDAIKLGWEARRKRNKGWDAKLAPVFEEFHRYGVSTARRYALALNAKGITSPRGKSWTEKSVWLFINRYRLSGGKVELIKRVEARIGVTRRGSQGRRRK